MSRALRVSPIRPRQASGGGKELAPALDPLWDQVAAVGDSGGPPEIGNPEPLCLGHGIQPAGMNVAQVRHLGRSDRGKPAEARIDGKAGTVDDCQIEAPTIGLDQDLIAIVVGLEIDHPDLDATTLLELRDQTRIHVVRPGQENQLLWIGAGGSLGHGAGGCQGKRSAQLEQNPHQRPNELRHIRPRVRLRRTMICPPADHRCCLRWPVAPPLLVWNGTTNPAQPVRLHPERLNGEIS